MALSFPANPSNGDRTTLNDRTYSYNSTTRSWTTVPTGATRAKVFQSDNSPSNPATGDLWYDTTELKLYTYYTDDSSNSHWVSTEPSGTVGSALDSADVLSITGGGGGGVTTYDSSGALPSSGASTGDFGFTTNTKSLYLYDGAEWDRVYTGAQENVQWNTELQSAYTLKVNDSATNFTVSATDPDGFDLTYSYSTSPSSVSFATITQRSGDSSNSFDILPDSAATGTFTFRVTADDGVSKIATSSTINVLASELLTGLTGGTGGTGGSSVYTAPGGMVVTAPGSTYTNNGYYFIEFLFDGANGTGNNDDIWLTNGGTNPGYLTFNLSGHTSPFGGNISYIEKIVVYPKVGADLTTFTNVTSVEWSTDGTTWTEAYGDQGWTSSVSLGFNEEFLINQNAAYFRLGLQYSGSWGFSLHGVEIYAG